MSSFKVLMSAGVIAASLLSSAGVAGAAGYAGGRGFVARDGYGNVYGAGGAGYAYNNGFTAGAGHVYGAVGPLDGGGYTAGTTRCVNGVSCTHYGQGATTSGAAYNTNVNAVNNGNGTWTINWLLNYFRPATGTQTYGGSTTIYR